MDVLKRGPTKNRGFNPVENSKIRRRRPLRFIKATMTTTTPIAGAMD